MSVLPGCLNVSSSAATCIKAEHITTIGLCVFEVDEMATTSIRLDQDLIEKAAIMAKAFNRTLPEQIEHWAKNGEIMEGNPDLPYEFVKQTIIAKAEREAGKLKGYNFS